jgi:hypothetical protein
VLQRQWAVAKWNVGGIHHFAKIHTTEDSARTEAERLAKDTPGAKFVVLRVVAEATVKINPVCWEEVRDDGWVPFKTGG